MPPIELISFEQSDFAREIKQINLNHELNFILNDQLAKNIEILVYYLILKKIKQITITKTKEEMDLVCHKIYNDYFKKYYLLNSSQINIKLENFLHTELQLLLGERFYLNYCSKQNIAPRWNENFLKKEKRKIDKHRNLTKYDTFKTLVKYQEDNPFSYFNFPEEENADRFVLYFHIYSEKQIPKILSMIKELGLETNKELINLITQNKINDEIYYYAFGFLYKENELERFTLYTKFAGNIIHRNGIKEFLERKHRFTLNEKTQNIWYYAIDFYKDNSTEIKIYDEPYKFSTQIDNRELLGIIENKNCVKVSKYKNNQKIGEKYEFEYKNFSNNEKQKLISLNLCKEDANILALYIKNNKIIKTVTYQLI